MKWLLIATCIFLSLTAYAEEKPIGVVALLDGGVFRAPLGDISKKVALKRNGKVYEKDLIITDDVGFVKILMNDDTVFDLGGTTKFSFDKFKLNSKNGKEAKEDRQAEYKFEYGKMRSIFTQKAKKEGDLKIKTPEVVMGIRGTEILADVYESTAGKLTTNIALVSGKLNIEMPSSKELVKNFEITPGAVFSSEKFSQSRDFNKSIEKLSKANMKKLTQVGMMKKGAFLFDTVNEGKPMPVSAAMKKIVDSVSNLRERRGDGKDGPRDRNGEGKGDKPERGDRPEKGDRLGPPGEGKPRMNDMKGIDMGLSPSENREFRKNLKTKLLNNIQKRRMRSDRNIKRKHDAPPPKPPGDFGGMNGTYTTPPPPPPTYPTEGP